MAIDMVLDLGDIKGESKKKGFAEKIDLLAWSWGINNSGSFHTGSGGGTGKASFQDISLTKFVDRASPTLMLYCANGKHIEKAKLVMRKAGGDAPIDYLVIELEKILVSGYSTGGSGGEEKLTENITLNFAQVKVSYVPQKDDGSPAAAVPFGWKIPEGTKL